MTRLSLPIACRGLRARLLLMSLLPCIAACRPASRGYERYVPSAEHAEKALDQVLSAWKNGEALAPLKSASTAVTIQIADTTRRSGQRLTDYELLGEVSGEGPRTFVVRLKLDHPSEMREARYYLVGIDPLWVFRQEDYNALVHWDACVRAEDEVAQRQHQSVTP
jgi:hypothetical protein